jgi:hypothetical protein
MPEIRCARETLTVEVRLDGLFGLLESAAGQFAMPLDGRDYPPRIRKFANLRRQFRTRKQLRDSDPQMLDNRGDFLLQPSQANPVGLAVVVCYADNHHDRTHPEKDRIIKRLHDCHHSSPLFLRG